MQQEEDQAQGQGFNPILPQNGPPVFAVPFPYFVPCSKCGSNEKNYLQQMSARPTPNTPANNYAVHSSLSHGECWKQTHFDKQTSMHFSLSLQYINNCNLM